MLTVTDEEGLTDTANVTIAVSTAGGGGGCAPVTAPWTSSDIGSVGAAGSACEESGRFEVDASGADIWNSSDEFHYVYQSLSGDGEIIARVVSLDNTNQWAKAGVMMRNTLDANSAFVLMSMSPNPNGQGPSYTLQQRNTAGEAMGGGNNIGPVAAGFPYYVRLVRQGNTFSGYASATNGNWSLLGSRTVAMGSTIYVGLAVTSHNDGVTTQAVFDNVSLQGGSGGGGNQPPTAVATASPLSGDAPLNVSFTGDSSTDDVGVESYSWDFGDGTGTSTLATPSYTYGSAGT